jgi:GNAT superfamily N-acetyltransferase
MESDGSINAVQVEIRVARPGEVEARLGDFVGLLGDAVDSGASVGFLGPLGEALAVDYWRRCAADAERGGKVLIVALEGECLVGSVQLALAAQQNGAHRAEIQRLVVLTSHRGHGLGRRLMEAAEVVALGLGRTLLTLNTRTGDPPEALYCRMGYVTVGTIPGFAQNPDGSFNTTTLMYKQLSAADVGE